jgi:hypothetical protein
MDNEMQLLERNGSGQFELKGDEPRILRSMRLTDTCWETLGEVASARKVSRSDLIEELVSEGLLSEDYQSELKDAKDEIISEIQDLIQGLEKGGDNELDLDHRDKAPGRRVLTALIDYLS